MKNNTSFGARVVPWKNSDGTVLYHVVITEEDTSERGFGMEKSYRYLGRDGFLHHKLDGAVWDAEPIFDEPSTEEMLNWICIFQNVSDAANALDGWFYCHENI